MGDRLLSSLVISGARRQHSHPEACRYTCIPYCSWDLRRGEHHQRLIQRLAGTRPARIPQDIDGEIVRVEQQHQSMPPTNTIHLLALKRTLTEIAVALRLQVSAQLR